MKLYRYLMTLATLLLVACSQDDGIPTPQFENVDIQASIVYGNMTGGFTRSNPIDESTQFSDDDVIAVKTDDDQEVTNYKLKGSAWESDNPLKWKQESLTFTAWYPIANGTSATNFTLPETLTEANIAQWDYMTATAVNATRKNGVNLVFNRKMALVMIDGITVDNVFGAGVTVSSITLHTNSCGYENGEVKTGTSEITMLNIEGKYYAIVSPTTEAVTSIFLTITLSNNETAIVKGIPALTAGNKYTYSLNVGREAVATSVSVDEWTSSTDNPLSLEGGLSYTISADGGTYTVYRAHGLMAWNTAVQDNKALNLTLGAEINMQGVEGWQQVSDYTGTVTGNGYTVSGLTMNVSSNGNAGFIAKLEASGKIINLNLAGLTVDGSATNVGGLVGENSGGTVGACSVTGAVTASSATGSVGGLVGLNSSGLVLSSYCTGTVTGSANVGSVVGKNMSDVTGCYYTGSSTGIGSGGGDATLVDNKNVLWAGEQSGKTNEIAVIIMNQLMKDWANANLGGKGWVYNDEASRPIIGNADFTKVIDYVIVNSDTYKVYTATGLIDWNNSKPENSLQSNLKIMDDIDLAGSSYNWRTHGWDTTNYNGTIDGNNKIIRGLTINSSKGYGGFVGVLGNKGVIKNLHLREVKINETGANYTGGIAGSNYGSIIGCSVGGYITSIGLDIAGVVGTNRGKIVACYNLAEIYTTASSNFDGSDKPYGVGGIVGRNYGEITSCYNLGEVSQKNDRYSIGAIVGSNEGSSYSVGSSYFNETTLSGIGDGTSGTTTEVVDGNWLTALETMNAAITSYGCKYVANGNSTTEPLKLIKTGN